MNAATAKRFPPGATVSQASSHGRPRLLTTYGPGTGMPLPGPGKSAQLHRAVGAALICTSYGSSFLRRVAAERRAADGGFHLLALPARS